VPQTRLARTSIVDRWRSRHMAAIAAAAAAAAKAVQNIIAALAA